MTFGQSYLTHLKCLENVGMTSIEPIEFQGQKIVPLQFLKAVLPDPASLGPRTKGKTNIGCIFRGVKDGKPKTYYRLQHLRPSGVLPRGRQPGDLLYHRRARDDRRDAGDERHMEQARRVEHGGVRSRPVHGRAEQMGPAVAGRLSPRAGGLMDALSKRCKRFPPRAMWWTKRS